MATNSATTPDAGLRAGIATATFTAAGVGSALRGVPDWGVSAPLGLTYGLLVAHTFCSVRCIGGVIPSRLWSQWLLDGTLIATYLALAASIADTVRFAAWASLLFALATLKYALLLGRLDISALLARKVRVDTIGTIASLLALMAASGGHERATAWALLGLNAIANVYLLWWNPLYRLRKPAAAAPGGAGETLVARLTSKPHLEPLCPERESR